MQKMNVGARKTLASFALMLLARTACAEGSAALPWQESFTARLEALALLQTLNAELLSHDSATLTLDRWCAAHRLASPVHIVAERVDGADQEPTDEQRQLLGVSATEPIRYLRVRLICGDRVLSEADNWYAPGGLRHAGSCLQDHPSRRFLGAEHRGRDSERRRPRLAHAAAGGLV
jgi:hypothetical protein